MTCKHVDAPALRIPGPSDSVYREDCTQCFDSIDSPDGLSVCLYCFNGGCASERNHAALHHTLTNHQLALNIKRKRKALVRDEPPQKMSKLAIAAETEADRYDYTIRVHCFECGVDDVDKSQGKLPQVVDGVMKANTFAQQEEIQAWEQELTACEHTLCLQQAEARQIESQGLGQCSKCDLKENLWLCLECGNLACGRAQFGGIGGNGHALAHGTDTDHPVAVKLGSLTADGHADVYCYACDDERVDPELTAHLANWGIDIAGRQKTEKSLGEMQIEQNLKYSFSMATADGKDAKPLFGQGFTGLKNLGNSCYLASTLQCLFDMPEFADRYYHPQAAPPAVAKPADDLETQLRKVADGLLSGRYSHPDNSIATSPGTEQVPHQQGLAPAMLKHLIGKGHSEFSSMRQQDAFEFLLHVLQTVSRAEHPDGQRNPVSAFQFAMEQRLQCVKCKQVRYRTDEMENITVPVPFRKIRKDSKMNDANGITADEKREEEKDEYEAVTLSECLDIFTGTEMVDLTCPSCGSNDGFQKRSGFKTLPEVLAVNCQRFALVNWVPTKLDVPVQVDNEALQLDKYKSHGPQEGEEMLPEDVDVGAKRGFVANELALSQLEAMGFPKIRCEKALKATGNSDAETASLWLFEHMEDPDIDAPMEPEGGSGPAKTIDAEAISNLEAMGFSAPQARQALKETGSNMERAVDWLFSHPDAQGDFGGDDAAAPAADAASKPLPGTNVFPAKFSLKSIVCHKGSSIHAGHYVAFVRKRIPETKKDDWVLFNDEKVAEAGDVEEMKKFAYVYFFRRAPG